MGAGRMVNLGLFPPAPTLISASSARSASSVNTVKSFSQVPREPAVHGSENSRLPRWPLGWIRLRCEKSVGL